MGFSVSASAAVIFLAAFLAFGTLYTTASNGYDQVQGARHAAAERALAQSNTAIRLDNATYGSGRVSLNVTNTGTTALSVNDTDVVLDNALAVSPATDVNGDATTDVWLPGETLHVVVTVSSKPTRVKVVTGNGVAVEGAI